MHNPTLWPAIVLLASSACAGDPAPTDSPVTDEVVTSGDTSDSGTDVSGLDVTVEVSDALPTDRLVVFRGTASDAGFQPEEVVADVALADTLVVRLDDPSSDAYFVFELYDDASGDGVYDDGDALHGASTMGRVWSGGGWTASQFFADKKPADIPIDSSVVLASAHREALGLTASVDVSKISNPERLTTVSGFVDVGDPGGALFDVSIDGASVSATAAIPATSRFRAPDGLPIALEHVIAIDDLDDSGSYTDGDALAAWVCFGADPTSVLYVTPPTDPAIMLAHAMFGVPNGFRLIYGFDEDGSVLEVDDAATLVLSDTACAF